MKQSIPLIAKPVDSIVVIPGSKSITNRALLMAVLSSNEVALSNVLDSDDTHACINVLRKLGVTIEWNQPEAIATVSGCRGQFPNQIAKFNCHDAGTVARFILPLCAAQPQGQFYITGSKRLCERPLKPLLQVLEQQGAEFEYLEKPYSMPLLLKSNGLKGGEVEIDTQQSSQFLSGLLLASPLANIPLNCISADYCYSRAPSSHSRTLPCHSRVGGNPGQRNSRRCSRGEQWIPDHRYAKASRGKQVRGDSALVRYDDLSYVCMTQQMLATFKLGPQNYAIEPDASTASYFFALAALTQGRITVPHLSRNGLQGDTRFLSLLEQMGCEVAEDERGITVVGAQGLKGLGEVSMTGFSDTFMTVATLAVFADGPTTLTGLAHTRLQESDRIAAMAMELSRLKVKVDTTEDSITIYPSMPIGAMVKSHADHRIAMSLALIGTQVPGIVIAGAECVSKTCPTFFAMLDHVVAPRRPPV